MNIPLASLATLLTAITLTQPTPSQATEPPLFDMQEMLDASTLDVEVLDDWHLVQGQCPTRQKLISIRVGELCPGREYYVPVRMIVPADRKARGFHLTGGHMLPTIQKDANIRGVDAALLDGGVGLVHTMVQTLNNTDQAELSRAAYDLFIETLNPHYSIQYWGWPVTLMRAITAAYAEDDHFEKGRIALSGGSKNGATPSVVAIQDERVTAVHAGVSPIWDSPLRLCDRAAWDALNEYNEDYVRDVMKIEDPRQADRTLNHTFLGGTFGPIYNRDALAAGHSWEDLQELAERMADQVFLTRNLEALSARDVDLFFHPGTHDMVAFDMAWGGRHHPGMSIYLGANSGHGKKGHPAGEKDQQNKSAFLLRHFFGDAVDPLLEPPTVSHELHGDQLSVTVTFPAGSTSESGRIWWMADRGPDGSVAYINELFPEEQWKDMQYDADKNAWQATIPIDPAASHIDFFSNHRKTLTYKSVDYRTYLSCPYTRVELEQKH